MYKRQNEETTYGVTHCKARRARRHGSDWSRVTSSRLAKILAQLALRGADGSGTMHLCEISAEVSGTTGAGIMLQSDELVRGSLCTTDGVAAYLDDLQYLSLIHISIGWTREFGCGHCSGEMRLRSPR